jgi:drug/metabolite transporter (DMT)-like permease
MAALMIFIWLPNRAKYESFKWRYAILMIGIVLTVSDFAYFLALSHTGALIAIIAAIRRSSIMVAFAYGAIMLNEKNVKSKVLILLGIFAGIVTIIVGSNR